MEYKRYPEYKESGVDWLGKIPAEWEVKKLKFLATVNDSSLDESTDGDYLMRYVDIGSVTYETGINNYQDILFENAPSRARRIVKNGDIIVSTVRTYLKAIARINDDKDVIVSTGFAVIRPRDIDGRFLSYFVKTPYFVEMISANSVGVSYPAIKASDMMSIEILMPPKSENNRQQQQIADYLDNETARITNIINTKTKLIEKLKEKRNIIISNAVTKGLDPTAKLKSSGVDWIDAIPEGWEVKKIKHIVATKVTDGPHITPEFVSDGVPFVSAESVKNNRIDLDFKRGFISESDHELFCKKCKPQKHDIFIIKSGATTGRIAYVDIDEEFSVWSPLALIRSKEGVYCQRYVFYAMLSDWFKKQVEISWSFGTQQNIGMGVIENLYIAAPELSIQQQIADYLDKETKKIDTIINKTLVSVDKLNEYQTSLISNAVTGKIDVRGE